MYRIHIFSWFACLENIYNCMILVKKKKEYESSAFNKVQKLL